MTAAKPTLTWYGHANVFISAPDAVFSIDPFFEGNPKAPGGWRTAPRPDIILLTHDHGDHLGQALEMIREYDCRVACIADLADWLQTQGVPGDKIINYGVGGNIDGTVREFGVDITMTQATHSCAHGNPVGYVLEFSDGSVIYHAGDTGLFGDMRLIGERFAIDLALLPVGGVFTMDGRGAAKACAMLGCKAAMPIHYGTFPVLAPDAGLFVESLRAEAPSCRAVVLAPGESVML